MTHVTSDQLGKDDATKFKVGQRVRLISVTGNENIDTVGNEGVITKIVISSYHYIIRFDKEVTGEYYYHYKQLESSSTHREPDENGNLY